MGVKATPGPEGGVGWRREILLWLSGSRLRESDGPLVRALTTPGGRGTGWWWKLVASAELQTPPGAA